MGITLKDKCRTQAISDFLRGGNKRGVRRVGKIGVLMGGPSTEREISLKSGKAVYESLKESGIEAIAIDITSGGIEENKELIKAQEIDCAFLALHGSFGEDGQIQKILDRLKIPYTGSGVSASRLAIDKIASRRLFEVSGLDVPKYDVLEKSSYKLSNRGVVMRIKAPFVVKPATHGSSVGLSIVDKKDDFHKAASLAFSFDERLIIEEYIKGREFTVGILEDKVLPVIEIIPKGRFFDYEAKYQSGMTQYVVPAELSEKITSKLKQNALMAHRVLGCYGCSRVDIILRSDNTPVVLEVNTIPGFTQTSLLPKAAKAAGIGFAQLCIKLIQLAYAKAEA